MSLWVADKGFYEIEESVSFCSKSEIARIDYVKCDFLFPTYAYFVFEIF